MAEKTEAAVLCDGVKWEQDGDYSREQIIIAAGSGNLPALTVLGRISASGKYAPLNPAASDGSAEAAGILAAPVDAVGADAPAAAVVRDALIIGEHLAWPAGITAPQKTTALAQLDALGIHGRDAA